jgi:hypothetical protein
MCWRGFHKILERHRQSRAVVTRYGADDTEGRRTYPARDRKRRQPPRRAPPCGPVLRGRGTETKV